MIGSGGRVGWRDIVDARATLRRRATTRCCASSSRDSYTRLQLIKWLGWRARSRKDQGLGPEASVLKLAASRRQELDGNLVLALQGAAGMLYDGDAVGERLLAAAVPHAVEQPASAAAPSRSSAT